MDTTENQRVKLYLKQFMKKTALAAIATAFLTITITACSGNDNQATDPNNQTTEEKQPATVDPGDKFESRTNIRYIDMDTLLTKYNLAKDVDDFIRQTTSNLEQQQRYRASEIQKFASQIEEKQRTGGYLTEESFNADMQKYQKMQYDAQNALSALQSKADEELYEQNRQLMDSIQTFLVQYNKNYHYDAILMKASGLYFNPSLDITDEVVEGLNARYNKQ